MSLFSMTGFARTDGEWKDYRWTWELKSVNARGLDVRMRLPSGLEPLESPVRKAISARLSRGNVNAKLELENPVAEQSVSVNEPALKEAIKLAKTHAKAHGLKPPRIEGLLGLRGIMEIGATEIPEADEEALSASLIEALEAAIDQLINTRRTEGEALAEVLNEQLDHMEGLIGEAEDRAATQPELIRQRLEEQIGDLLSGKSANVEPERLAQEVALMAVKADVREELDRLRGHVEAARDHLRQGSPVGRQLDFLAQEFSREANTLCSKSVDEGLSRAGLAMKSVIDQMREQVQNVE